MVLVQHFPKNLSQKGGPNESISPKMPISTVVGMTIFLKKKNQVDVPRKAQRLLKLAKIQVCMIIAGTLGTPGPLLKTVPEY